MNRDEVLTLLQKNTRKEVFSTMTFFYTCSDKAFLQKAKKTIGQRVDTPENIEPTLRHVLHHINFKIDTLEAGDCRCDLYAKYRQKHHPRIEMQAARIRFLRAEPDKYNPSYDAKIYECNACGTQWKVLALEYHATVYDWSKLIS